MLKLRVYEFWHFPVINLALKSQVPMPKSKPMQKVKESNGEKALIFIVKSMLMAKVLIQFGNF
jgi:hypothetical protein